MSNPPFVDISVIASMDRYFALAYVYGYTRILLLKNWILILFSVDAGDEETM